MCVHMWEPWEWAGVSGVDVFSPPESSSKLALAHRASGTEVYTTQTSERYHRGMSMRNVEFPELEHAKAQAEEERERVCRFEKPLTQRGPHCVVCAASRCRAVINWPGGRR